MSALADCTPLAAPAPENPQAELARLRAELADTRRQLEQTQRANHLDSELLSFFLEHVPDSVFFKDLDSRFLRCSTSCAQPHGQTAAGFVGKTDFDFFPREEAASFMAADQTIIASGQPLLGCLEHQSLPDGRRLWTSTSRLPLRDRTGKIIGTFGMSKDVSAWKQLEHDLLSSKNFYSALVESLPMMIIRKDDRGRFTFVNQLFCNALGQPPEAVLGKTDFDIFPAELATKFRQDDLDIIAGRVRREYDEDSVAADGRVIRYHVTKMPLSHPDGTPAGIQVVFWDTTERHRAEEQLKIAQRELVEASRLAGMAEVASGVLHNIGNVLNSVNVSATLVGDRVRQSRAANLAKVAALLTAHSADLGAFVTHDPKGRLLPGYLVELATHLDAERVATLAELELLRRNIEHIKDIVSMQQSYARVSGVKEAHAAVELVEDALRMNLSAFTRHDITLIRDFRPAPKVMVEKHKVLQILVNLLRNAKHAVDDAAPLRKQLSVSIVPAEDGRCVRILVEDNGVGIPPENLTRIFSFGFTTKKDGHGFGLHTSVLAAREMGGALRVQSDGVGRGAVFTLELPVELSPAE